ncbi:B12-binding domain-containing radical SAM protein [Alkaliflexus imshenetskii]|uniref:B12-binding domain-containing radical SAM protein n=1 Tax=Alkaliflexus imshenetskii TaxID=286730 RepID=UPI00047E536A|nr:B12-binding domain-containing radical SAM protein [Alkaliflexus imshenetskii]
MKVLLIYPKYPDSFWSFTHVLPFIKKKAAVPPLGLITVSAMLPATWQKKMIDLNVTPLQSFDIIWADYVFISAMYIQKESVIKIIGECQKHETKIVAGGPLFTQEYMDYPQIDHFVLNEAEITLPLFLEDLSSGKTPERIYQTKEFPSLNRTPVPDYHLLSQKDYVFMNIQVSRGCPYSCDFCEITTLLGNKVRMKETRMVLKEMEALYDLNWRGPVLIVDDNFIGNKHVVKNELLPAMKKWMVAHKYPFTFNTETSINLADDEELLNLMVETGFKSTFVGIETPEEMALQECNKNQNKNRDLLESVKTIQRAGMQVSGGFIVGFDSDTPSVFQRQVDFIQQSGIVSAMVGLLNAPKNTQLYKRMEAENRLTKNATGNNTDSSMNFIPKMNYHDLLAGYHKIIHDIYDAKPFYNRIRQCLINYRKPGVAYRKKEYKYVKGFVKSVLILGFVDKGRLEYWKLLMWILIKKPQHLIDALVFTVYGYHFRTVYGLRT